MAVVDKYTDANLEADKKTSGLTSTGADKLVIQATVAVAAGDDNNSVYRIFKSVPASLVPTKIEIHNTAITGGTDYDLGLYGENRGAVVDADILADGLSMATARTIATANNAGLTTIDIADGSEDLAAISGQSEPDAAYDIAFTANTVGTAAGTIRVTGEFAYK